MRLTSTGSEHAPPRTESAGGLCHPGLVSSPDPDSQQLRVDYITATWKVGLGNKNDALVPSVPQCLCPKIVRQSNFRTNLAQLESNKRYHFRMILLRVLCIYAKQVSKFTKNNYLECITTLLITHVQFFVPYKRLLLISITMRVVE